MPDEKNSMQKEKGGSAWPALVLIGLLIANYFATPYYPHALQIFLGAFSKYQH